MIKWIILHVSGRVHCAHLKDKKKNKPKEKLADFLQINGKSIEQKYLNPSSFGQFATTLCSLGTIGGCVVDIGMSYPIMTSGTVQKQLLLPTRQTNLCTGIKLRDLNFPISLPELQPWLNIVVPISHLLPVEGISQKESSFQFSWRICHSLCGYLEYPWLTWQCRHTL